MSRENAQRRSLVLKNSALGLAALAAMPALVSRVFAQTSLTWDADLVSAGPQDGAGSWDNQTTANWFNGTNDVQWNNNNNDTAVFGAGGTGGSVTVIGGVTVGGLTINSPSYSFSGANITSGVGSTAYNINRSATISNNIDGNGAAFVIAPTATLQYLGTYSGGANLILTGGGTLDLGNSSTAFGNVATLDARGGTLRWGNTVTIPTNIIANAGLTNTITLGGNGSLNGAISGSGTLIYSAATAGNILSINGDDSAFTGTISMLNSGTIRFTSTAASLPNAWVDLGSTGVIGARLSSSTISLGALSGVAGSRLTGGIGSAGNVTYEIGTLGVNSTFNGVINDLGGSTITSVRKVGGATLFLGGSNTYTGPTTVAGGTLALLSGGTLNGTKNVFVNTGGTLDVTGTGGYTIPAGQALTGDGGQIIGNVNVTNPTGIVNAGTSSINDLGQLTFRNNLTVNGGSLQFDLGGGTADLDNVLGTLTLTSGNIFVDPHGNTGDFTLLNFPTNQTPATGNTPLLFASRTIGNLTSGAGTIGVHISGFSAAADVTWASTSDSNWDVQVHSNWKSNVANPDKFFAGDNVHFGDPTGLQTAITKVGLLQPGSLTLENNIGSYTIGGSGTIGDTPTGALTVNKTGTGTVIFSTANSYTGGTNINAGTLEVGNGGAVGSGPITLNGGAFRLQGVGVSNQININTSGSTLANASGSGTISGTVVDNGNQWNVAIGSGVTINVTSVTFAASSGLVTGTINFNNSVGDMRVVSTAGIDLSRAYVDLGTASARIFNNGGGTIKLGALASSGAGTRLQAGTANITYEIGARNNDSTFAGAILQSSVSGQNATVSITKVGTGTLRLTGDDTSIAYRGTTTVTSGTLLVNGVHVPAAGGAYTVNGALGGNGIIGGAVTVNGSGTLAPGDSVGTMTVGTLVLNGGSNLNIDFNHSGSDKVDVKNTITAASTVNINPSDASAGAMIRGVYPIVDYTGTSPGTANFSLTSASVGGFALALNDNPVSSAIELIATGGSGPANEQWNVDADGTWTTGSNWTQAVVPNGTDYVANFGGAITAARNVTVSGNVSVAKVNFDTYATTAGTYTIGGTGILTLASTTGVGTINDQAGNHQLAAGLTVQMANTTNVNVNAGSDTLTVGAALAGSGSLNKSGRGTLALTGNNTYTGGTSVNAGTLTAIKLSNGTLTVAGGFAQLTTKATANDISGTTVVPALTLSGGTLDITNNALIVDYTTLGTQLTDLRASALAGRIKTSTSGLAVAYADNATLGRATFGGVGVDGTSLLVAATVSGDANIDGRVNALDFNALANNFGATSKVWTDGDFTYDGVVNTSDFTLLSQNFNKTTTAPGATLGSLVPEPASLGLIAMAGLFGRRRRRF